MSFEPPPSYTYQFGDDDPSTSNNSNGGDEKKPSAPSSLFSSIGGELKYKKVKGALAHAGASEHLPAFKAEDLDDDTVQILSEQSSSEFRQGVERLGLSMGEALKFTTYWNNPNGTTTTTTTATTNLGPITSALAGRMAKAGSVNESKKSPRNMEMGLTSGNNATSTTPAEEDPGLALLPVPTRRSWLPTRFAWVHTFTGDKDDVKDDGTFAFFAGGNYVPRGVFSVGVIPVGIIALGGLPIGVIAAGPGAALGLIAFSQMFACGLFFAMAQMISIGGIAVAQMIGIGVIHSRGLLSGRTGFFGENALIAESPVWFPRDLNATGSATDCGVILNNPEDIGGSIVYSITAFALLGLFSLAMTCACRSSYRAKYREANEPLGPSPVYGIDSYVCAGFAVYWIAALVWYIYVNNSLNSDASGSLTRKGIAEDVFGCWESRNTDEFLHSVEY